MASAKPCSVKRKITARDTNSRSDHLFFLFALTGMFSRDLYNLINFYLFHFKSLHFLASDEHSPTCIDSISLFDTRTNDVD